MAANNLRVIYNNIADIATITSNATASSYPTTNMQSDTKGLVWRSTSQSSTTITLSWLTSQTVNAVILPFTNLSTTATIRVILKDSLSATLYDSGSMLAVPYTLSSNGVSQYGYGGGSTVRVYTPISFSTVRTIDIILVDASSAQGYMEVSRLICGSYWSPVYNTEFGISVDYKEQSQHSRAQAGNIITDISPTYKVLNFTLGYMTVTDRNNLVNILRLNGMRKAIWVSIFPSDSDAEKEYIYSIYGKLSQNATITHPMFSQYVSNIAIEEV